MEYIREQLVAYQEQLKELALHNAWKVCMYACVCVTVCA